MPSKINKNFKNKKVTDSIFRIDFDQKIFRIDFVIV